MILKEETWRSQIRQQSLVRWRCLCWERGQTTSWSGIGLTRPLSSRKTLTITLLRKWSPTILIKWRSFWGRYDLSPNGTTSSSRRSTPSIRYSTATKPMASNFYRPYCHWKTMKMSRTISTLASLWTYGGRAKNTLNGYSQRNTSIWARTRERSSGSTWSCR